MNLAPFGCWSGLLQYLSEQSPVSARPLYYKAPLDARARAVMVVRVFKNGKLRIDPLSNDADCFTADAHHLDRFFYPEQTNV